MNQYKKFGALTSSVDSNGFSLAWSSGSQLIISLIAAWAVTKGLDAMAITSQIQSIFDQGATLVSAGLVVYHSVMTIWGLVRKLEVLVAAPKVNPLFSVGMSTGVPQPMVVAQTPEA